MRWVCVPTGFEDGFEGRERRVHVAVVLGICLVVVAVLCPRNGIFLFFFPFNNGLYSTKHCTVTPVGAQWYNSLGIN